MNKEEIIKFKEGLDQLNIYLSEHQYLQFRQFFDMLEEKNKVMNLTAITDGVEEMCIRDSIGRMYVAFSSMPEKRKIVWNSQNPSGKIRIFRLFIEKAIPV